MMMLMLVMMLLLMMMIFPMPLGGTVVTGHGALISIWTLEWLNMADLRLLFHL